MGDMRKRDKGQNKYQALLNRRRTLDRKRTVKAAQYFLSEKQKQRLGDAYDLIDESRFDQAEMILRELDQRVPNSLDVLMALANIYGLTNQTRHLLAVTRQLVRLEPDNDDVLLAYAHASLYSMRPLLALKAYQAFVERSSDLERIAKAKEAMEIASEENERRRKLNLESSVADDSLELLELHELCLESLEVHEIDLSIQQSRQLLKKWPKFIAARNNLTLSLFVRGELTKAISISEESHLMDPTSVFAIAILARLYFIAGRTVEANQMADRIPLSDPPEQDPLLTSMETLSMLGRDDDLAKLCEAALAKGELSRSALGAVYHYQGYIAYRQGRKGEARSLWKQASHYSALFNEAAANLEDLSANTGHAAWPVPLSSWISQEVLGRIIEGWRNGRIDRQKGIPQIQVLVPSLLDRGDPAGRDLALNYAKHFDSPQMREALKEFGLGERGSDSLRTDALNFLLHRDYIGEGPHRFFSQGEWRDIELVSTEIYGEPKPSLLTAKSQRLMEKGTIALQAKQFDLAESCFQQVLLEKPEYVSAINNLCVIWKARDGEAGERRAVSRLEQLVREQPEYVFARVALCDSPPLKDNPKKAKEFLQPLMKLRRLHRQEAIVLYSKMATIALTLDEIDQAERFYELLTRIDAGEDELTRNLKDRIDLAKGKVGVGQLKRLANRIFGEND